MPIVFALLAVAAVLAVVTVTWQARREAMVRLALGGLGATRRRAAVLRGEALFATGIDRSTVAFDCLVTSGEAPLSTPEPTSLMLRRRNPSWSGQSLADVVRSWAECGERVFVEVALDSPYGPWTAHLTCGVHGLEADVTNRGELRRLIGRPSVAWPG